MSLATLNDDLMSFGELIGFFISWYCCQTIVVHYTFWVLGSQTTIPMSGFVHGTSVLLLFIYFYNLSCVAWLICSCAQEFYAAKIPAIYINALRQIQLFCKSFYKRDFELSSTLISTLTNIMQRN